MLRGRFEPSIQAAIPAALSIMLLLPCGMRAQMLPEAAPTKGAALPNTIEAYGSVPAKPFKEATRVVGTVDTDLTGLWLLLAYAEVAPGRAKTFAQLLNITKGPTGPEIHLVDVRWPAKMAAALKDANNRTVVAWTPTAEDRAELAKGWATLPKQEQKFLDEFHYAKVDFSLYSPDRYADSLKRDDALDKTLAGSKFALMVAEEYYPRDMGELNNQISQLASRSTIYAFKNFDNGVWKGNQVLGFVAAGAGSPIPLTFGGPFAMYRLAKP